MARGRTARLRWALAGTGIAAVLVVVAVRTAGAASYTSAGISDPGAFTALATALSRLAAVVSGSFTLGGLVYLLLCTPPQESGLVGVEGYRVLGVARRWAPVWALAALVMSVCTAANSSGASVLVMLRTGRVLQYIDSSEVPQAWLVTAAGAVIIAVVTRISLSTTTFLGLAAIAAIAVAAPGVTGNAGEGPGHDLATNAIIVHSVAASLWLGMLFVLLSRRRATPEIWAPAWARYRVAAAVCWWALAGSGFMLAAQLLTWRQLLSTGYGRLTVATAVVLALTGWASIRWRRRTAAAVPTTPATTVRGRTWLLGVELILLLVAVGASVAMAQRPAAAFLVQSATENQLLIGFDLPHGFSIGRLAGLWRFDILLGTVAVVVAVLYLAGVRRVVRSGRPWPARRTVAFSAGSLVLLLATSSGVTSYAEATFGVHMTVHMMLNMVVPILWLLGAPITLIRSAVAPAATGGSPGAREWLARVGRSRLVRALTNPLINVPLYAISMFGLYFSPALYIFVLYHWGHQVMNVYFLGLGLLFYWPLLGVDRAPHRLPALARIGALLLLMPFDAAFGLLVASTPTVLAGNFYLSLTLPWLSSPLADQHAGGVIAWIVGDVVLLAVIIGLARQWARTSGPGDLRSDTPAAYQQLIEEFTEQRR